MMKFQAENAQVEFRVYINVIIKIHTVSDTQGPVDKCQLKLIKYSNIIVS